MTIKFFLQVYCCPMKRKYSTTSTLVRVTANSGCRLFGLDRLLPGPEGKDGYAMILLSKLCSMSYVPSGPNVAHLTVMIGFPFLWFTLRLLVKLFIFTKFWIDRDLLTVCVPLGCDLGSLYLFYGNTYGPPTRWRTERLVRPSICISPSMGYFFFSISCFST
jgi:hypothetical protein